MRQNFNVTPHTQTWLVTEKLALKGQIVNYKSRYVNTVRALSSLTATPAGPLLLTAPGQEALLAEYASTPGKRLDGFADVLSESQ